MHGVQNGQMSSMPTMVLTLSYVPEVYMSLIDVLLCMACLCLASPAGVCTIAISSLLCCRRFKNSLAVLGDKISIGHLKEGANNWNFSLEGLLTGYAPDSTVSVWVTHCGGSSLIDLTLTHHLSLGVWGGVQWLLQHTGKSFFLLNVLLAAFENPVSLHNCSQT